MSKCLAVLLLSLVSVALGGATWEWVTPADLTAGNPGSATQPGSRSGASAFGSGAAFGRSGVSDLFNDVWSFSELSATWTRLYPADGVSAVNQVTQGHGSSQYPTNVFASGNVPGSRRVAAAWSLTSGMYVFGGSGYSINNVRDVSLGDTWEFNPQTALWRAVLYPIGDGMTNGAANVWGVYPAQRGGVGQPGSRQEATAITSPDKTRAFLFGGGGYPAVDAGNGSQRQPGTLGDLWEFRASTDEWVYLSGPNAENVDPTYGTRGVPSATNQPGGRQLAAGAASSTALYIFGGRDALRLNDLWRFDLATSQWTWLAGHNGFSSPGDANTPSARRAHFAVNLGGSPTMLAIGFGNVESGSSSGPAHDLWTLDLTQTADPWRFTRVSAALPTDINKDAVPGTQGVPSASTYPGSLQDVTVWSTTAGFMIAFGNGCTNQCTASPLERTTVNTLWSYASQGATIRPTVSPAPTVPPTNDPFTNSPTLATPAPTTVAPTTGNAGVSNAPTTIAPTTVAPTTVSGGTNAPTTGAPTTIAPTTAAGGTSAPTTGSPTTLAGGSSAPTTLAGGTGAPTVVSAGTNAPTTLAPTSAAPTTLSPTANSMAGGTFAPTTLAPTTAAPTTVSPTAAAPTNPPSAGPSSGAGGIILAVTAVIASVLMVF